MQIKFDSLSILAVLAYFCIRQTAEAFSRS
jgi:hypothetical protein